MWTLPLAIQLCSVVESIAPAFGCHVALTGGLLYKDGPRKDLDILFYRIRQVDKIDVAGLFGALAAIGTEQDVWCVKASYFGDPDKPIDCFFPDIAAGSYPTSDEAAEKAVF